MNEDRLVKLLIAQLTVLGACDIVTGKERTIEELVQLLVTPQGVEFCINTGYPTIEAFRQFKRFGVEKYDVYIDTGEIALLNKKRAVLIGNTTATVFCDRLARHEIVVLRGAKAVINASQWAVVRAQKDADSEFIKHATDHAKII